MNRLKYLREEKGLSLKDLQDNLMKEFNVKVSRASLSNYEREEQAPKIETWEILANYFKVTPAYIMGLSPIREAPNFFPVDRSTLTSQNKKILDEINEIFEQLIQQNHGWTAIQIQTIFENLNTIIAMGHWIDEDFSSIDALASFSSLVKDIVLDRYSKAKDINAFLNDRNKSFQQIDKLFIDHLENRD